MGMGAVAVVAAVDEGPAAVDGDGPTAADDDSPWVCDCLCEFCRECRLAWRWRCCADMDISCVAVMIGA